MHTVPIFEGYGLFHVDRNNFAGWNLSDHMVKLLNEVGINLTSSSEYEIARKMKEDLCYVAINSEADDKGTYLIMQFISNRTKRTRHIYYPTVELSTSAVKNSDLLRPSLMP
jgi:hypothetical protein